MADIPEPLIPTLKVQRFLTDLPGNRSQSGVAAGASCYHDDQGRREACFLSEIRFSLSPELPFSDPTDLFANQG